MALNRNTWTVLIRVEKIGDCMHPAGHQKIHVTRSKLTILNCYAGIGGNRKLWPNDRIDVVAVEINPVIAEIYRSFFPCDKIIVGDAHQYLHDHYSEFDIVWSSPPCQSHSSFRQNISVRYGKCEAEYPDMRLYQEILFLQYNSKGTWIVENVRPYYRTLIAPSVVLQRHPFWSNISIEKKAFKRDLIRSAQIPDLQKMHGFDLSTFKVKDKRQVLRNCVSPEIGLYVFKEVERHLAHRNTRSWG